MQIITTKEEAIEKLLEQELVAIFQGHSEWGARALGNRSMLFDPRNKNAKEIVNKQKGRQWWRPTYYDLIKLFYDKTKVPLLLNTSFNLNGYPIVETYEDAVFTCTESKIKYLYTPKDATK